MNNDNNLKNTPLETYLLVFRAQYEGKMELSHDMVSFP